MGFGSCLYEFQLTFLKFGKLQHVQDGIHLVCVAHSSSIGISCWSKQIVNQFPQKTLGVFDSGWKIVRIGNKPLPGQSFKQVGSGGHVKVVPDARRSCGIVARFAARHHIENLLPQASFSLFIFGKGVRDNVRSLKGGCGVFPGENVTFPTQWTGSLFVSSKHPSPNSLTVFGPPTFALLGFLFLLDRRHKNKILWMWTFGKYSHPIVHSFKYFHKSFQMSNGRDLLCAQRIIEKLCLAIQ